MNGEIESLKRDSSSWSTRAKICIALTLVARVRKKDFSWERKTAELLRKMKSFQIVPISPMANKSVCSAFTKQQCYKEKVKQRLVKLGSENKLKMELVMIDKIQRLGMEHLFSEEIGDAMKRQYNAWCQYQQNDEDEEDEVDWVTLRFRLLRQQGYYVDADIFKKFKNKEGKFNSNNIEGLMELYEASQMRIKGEDILDEANDFTADLLQDLDHNKPHHAKKYSTAINSVLRLPFHKSLPKFTAMEILQSSDHSSEGWLLELQDLAKLDFDIAATNYKHEFLQFSRWWKETGLAKELELVRDESVKWYSWTVAAQPRLDLWEERLDVAKPTALVYVVDDLFDVYGNLHHLSLFTQAINSWNSDDIEELPQYMRSTWKAIFDTTNEISHKIWMKHGVNLNSYLRKLWADFCNACLTEVKWNASRYSPTASEYLKLGIVTCGAPMILSHFFFLVVETLDAQTLQLLNDDPRIITNVATIVRLSDDLGSAKDEGQNGYDGSYVNCYMKENTDVSEEEARRRVNAMISEAWKELNKECMRLQPHPFSSTHTFGRACLNSARMVPLMYDYKHGHLPGLDKFLMLLLNGS